jgi:Rieske Fe-S protein
MSSRECDVCSRRQFLFAGLMTLPVLFIAADPASAGSEKRYPIPAGDSVNIDRGEAVIVARVQGHAYAFSLACPHQQAAVKWVPADHRFQCTKHDSKYDPQGVHISGRATRNLDRLPIRRDGNMLVVDLDRAFRSDTDPAGWAAATVALP